MPSPESMGLAVDSGVADVLDGDEGAGDEGVRGEGEGEGEGDEDEAGAEGVGIGDDGVGVVECDEAVETEIGTMVGGGFEVAVGLVSISHR